MSKSAARQGDPHGCAPNRSPTALLLIDVINDLYLGARRLILTGFAADICVLYTANDAYMRDYELIVPSDCIASETLAAKRTACAQMKRFLRADVRSSRHLR
jgi:nicotinamidase-related amidase